MFDCFAAHIVQKRILRKTLCCHKGSFVPMTSARRIGFIVNADETGAEQAVMNIKQVCDRNRIEYKGIYLDFRKNPPEDPRYLSTTGLVTVNRNNVNWYGLPDEDTVSAFTKLPFDVLMDLTVSRRMFTADYILRKATASFRIGISSRPTGIYDMTVSGRDEENGIDTLTVSIFNYLTSIHTV